MPTISQKHQRKPKTTTEDRRPWENVSVTVFIVSLALVACRALMGDSIRAVLDPLEGSIPTPSAPGPGTSIALDLLCCLPALILLCRAVLDRTFLLTRSWLYWPMLALGGWAVLSVLWASDQFAAIVSASHFAAAMIFLWSASQIVRSWIQMRLVAGLALGLLLALLYTGYNYRFVEAAAVRNYFEQNPDELLQQNHIKPNSPEEFLFRKRVMGGEPMGFSTSTNSYAAIVVMLGTIAAGIAIQRRSDGDHFIWVILPVVAVAACVPAIIWTHCRAARATPVLAAVAFIVIAIARPVLRRFARPLFFTAIASIALVTTIIVHHGLRYGTLWQDSLNFRWTYWVGSYRVLMQDVASHHYARLLRGVGFENFGPHYLAHRMQVAAEEIRDPHNFIVRAFVELGLIGGELLLIWMLKLWWEMTRPVLPVTQALAMPGVPKTRRALWTLAAICSVAIGLNIALSVDFLADPGFVLLETVRRLLFFGFLFGGLVWGALVIVRQPDDVKAKWFELDGRPAPWMLYGTIIALGGFLVHNLIEFSFYETGPLFLFALLAGAVLGIRQSGRPIGQTYRNRSVAITLLSVATVGWFAWAIGVFAPIALAEGAAHDADDAARAGHFRQASDLMRDAFAKVPYNADYAMRRAIYLSRPDKGGPPIGRAQLENARTMLDAAIAADPSSMPDLVARAQVEIGPPFNEIEAARRDYRQAIQLDPANLRLRVEYAMKLRELFAASHQQDMAAEALAEFYRAKERNEEYHWDEPKRLSPDELKRVDAAIVELRGSAQSGR
ncbi:MAG TPA: hypothetical protein VH370_18760 [Humisphaera sp.]|jgi:hypothetical protein|nr:hypothetical protein [Humisphaera sp.]